MAQAQDTSLWLNFPTHSGSWFISHISLAAGDPFPLRVEVAGEGARRRALIYYVHPMYALQRFTIFEHTNETFKFYPIVTPPKP